MKYTVQKILLLKLFFALGNIMSVRKNNDKNIVLDRDFVLNYFWNSNYSKECEKIFNIIIKLIG